MRPHFTLALLALSATAAATPTPEAETEQAELLALLAEQTEIATKTRLNADYVPGIVSVLQGSDLAERGARTVWEALSFVAGIDAITDQVGHRRIVIRGLGAVGDSYASGNVKVLLNGTAVNNSERGFADPVFLIPIEQVERIEVIRGPGSAVYGEYALAGVVNVITRVGDRVFARIGAHNENGGGFSFENGSADGAHLSLNLAGWGHGSTGRQTGNDAANQLGIPDASHAPGEANDVTASRSAVGEFTLGGFTLRGQWVEHELGDHFGINYLLPPDTGPVERNRIRSLEADYRHRLGSGEVHLFAGDQNTLLRKDDLYAYPPEYLGEAGDAPLSIWIDYEERRRYFGTDLTWHLRQHNLLLGLYHADVTVEQDRQSYNLTFTGDGIPVIGDDPVDYGHPVQAGTRRRIDSVVMQDEFRATDQLTLTAGLRYDGYEGFDSSLSPRVAVVWRADQSRIVKAQFGRSFRPPTLNEQALGDPDIHPVTADTFELGYIVKRPRGAWRLTLYRTLVDDIIVFDPSGTYFHRNGGSAVHRGAELEADRQVGTSVLLNGLLSYLDAENQEEQTVPGSSAWQVRLGARYRPDRLNTLAIEWRWNAEYARQLGDPRPPMDGNGLVDVTWTHAIRTGWNLQLGVKNLFDASASYPAFLVTDATGEDVVSYPGDLPGAPRAWWFTATADF